MDRHLHIERGEVYHALAHECLADLPQLLIVVDWWSLTADMQWHWLHASVVVDGRSIIHFGEVHARQHPQQVALRWMSNNVKHRNTLSVITLATRIIERLELLRNIMDAWEHVHTLRRQTISAISGTLQGA